MGLYCISFKYTIVQEKISENYRRVYTRINNLKLLYQN